MNDTGERAWCRANYCSHRVRPGTVLCTAHRADLTRVAPELLAGIAGIDPRGIETSDRVNELEAIASAVEAIATAERNPLHNPYRRAAGQIRGQVRRAEPSVQARLIEDHPDLGGAYGPEGRRR